MRVVKLIAAILASLAAGAIGSLATIPNIPTWYQALEKPPLLPPNEVFGPVWTILYVMMGASLYLVWTSVKKGDKTKAYTAFVLQLGLNAMWSIVFFGLHLPLFALLIMAALIVAVVMCCRLFKQFSRPAMYLLFPYLAWLSFATYLNIGVAVLN